jgi:hypothetical protein
MPECKYFKIPFDKVPANPTFKVWYATWSEVRPEIDRGLPPPLVVGFIEDGTLPPGATKLASSSASKTPPTPPPPFSGSEAEYAAAVAVWLKETQGI